MKKVFSSVLIAGVLVSGCASEKQVETLGNEKTVQNEKIDNFNQINFNGDYLKETMVLEFKNEKGIYFKGKEVGAFLSSKDASKFYDIDFMAGEKYTIVSFIGKNEIVDIIKH